MAAGRLKNRYTIRLPRQFHFKNTGLPAPSPLHLQPILSNLPFPDGVVAFTSPHERCGIAEYSKALDSEFRALGIGATETPLADFDLLRRAPRGSKILVHVEPSLVPNGLEQVLAQAKVNGAKIIVCFHYFDQQLLRRFEPVSSAMVTHRHYLSHPRITEIPLACLVYLPGDRTDLRRRLGLPTDKIVISTAGFLSPWKKTPEIASKLIPRLGDDLHLQLACSTHYSDSTGSEFGKLFQFAGGDARVTLIGNFIPTSELLDRAAASDVGFVYHGEHTGSVSAVTKLFISGRCPLVLTESTHSSDVRYGAEHSPGLDMDQFVERVLAVARDPVRLRSMREAVERDYERLNMRRAAQAYLDLFAELP